MNWQLLAQAAPAPPGIDPFAVAKVALRRFFGGGTLSSPEPIPSTTPIVALAAGLALFALIVVATQGPGTALRQLLDIPGLWRVFQATLDRFKRSGRMAAALFGSAVLTWTIWQSRFFADTSRLEDLSNLLKRKSLPELSLEQGLLAALMPVRDVAALSSNLVMLLALAALVFKVSSDRWNTYDDIEPDPAHRLPGWTSPAWAAAWAYSLYRIATLIWRADGQPLGIFPIAEAIIVPPLMLICDALLFAWVLSELRFGQSDSISPPITQSVAHAIARLPSAMIACALIMPARYLATAASLTLRCFPQSPPAWLQRALGTLLIDWGMAWVQAAAIAALTLIAAATYGRDRGGALYVWRQSLKYQGGRMLATLIVAMLSVGACVALTYLTVLSLPAQPWVLAAADSYAHYVSLPLGVLLIAAFVELAHQATTKSPSGSTLEIDDPSALSLEPLRAEHHAR